MPSIFNAQKPVQRAFRRPRGSLDPSGALLVRLGLDRDQLGPDGSPDAILAAGHQFGALPDQLVGSEAGTLGYRQGTPNTSGPNFMASRAAIREPEYGAPSTTTTPSAIPAVIRFRIGNFGAQGRSGIRW
jgi:hypothetical protein